MNTALVGATVFIMYIVTKQKSNTIGIIASKVLPRIFFPVIEDIPFIGRIVSGHNIMTYVAFILIGVTWFIIYKTRIGLRIRSVGENPDAAASVGVSPIRIYCISFIISGIIAGLGGIYMSMGLMSYFARDMIAGRGMIGVSAMRVANGSPSGSAIFAVLFGVSDTVANYLQLVGLPPQLIAMFPYAMAIVIMIILAFIQKCSYDNYLKKRLK
jgi:simple sugar transport system permease protein